MTIVFCCAVDEVLPSKYGSKKDPLFCLPNRQRQANASGDGDGDGDGDGVIRVHSLIDDSKLNADVKREFVRAQNDEHMKTTVKLRRLRKVFPDANAGKGLVAVHDLSMVFEYGTLCVCVCVCHILMPPL